MAVHCIARAFLAYCVQCNAGPRPSSCCTSCSMHRPPVPVYLISATQRTASAGNFYREGYSNEPDND